MPDEIERTFCALVEGKIDSLKFAVNVGMTNANRAAPNTGIWIMTRKQFEVIVDSLRDSMAFFGKSLYEIAIFCDETGIDNRFFRLNRGVAEWIDNNDPESTFDFMVV